MEVKSITRLTLVSCLMPKHTELIHSKNVKNKVTNSKSLTGVLTFFNPGQNSSNRHPAMCTFLKVRRQHIVLRAVQALQIFRDSPVFAALQLNSDDADLFQVFCSSTKNCSVVVLHLCVRV